MSAVFSVPGDALAGAAAAGLRPNRRTGLAVCASLCLYEAGMALNDWADRDIDAVERPHRPLPSGRLAPAAALGAAVGLTAAGLALAGAAGRAPLITATALAGTVWAYDLRLKQTAAGPAAMACARSLDLLLGAVATTSGTTRRPAMPRGRRAMVVARLAPAAGGLGGGAHSAVAAGARGGSASAGSAAGVSGGTVFVVPPVGGLGVGAPVAVAAGARGGSTSAGSAAGASGGPVSAAPTTGAPGSNASAVATAVTAARSALPAAVLLGAHTFAVTTVSRREAQGGSTALPLAALAAVAAIGQVVGRGRPEPTGASQRQRRARGASRAVRGTAYPARRALQQSDSGYGYESPPGAGSASPAAGQTSAPPGLAPRRSPFASALGIGASFTRPAPAALLALGYAVTAGRPLGHAVLNPSPYFLQRAVGGGIRAMIPLQAALTARAGSPRTAAVLLGLLPIARRLSRKVSPT
ncbi:UbiA family prenyltransferase [Streptomyces sp. H27-D2]|uniref:UbiA family prenyltransferase n=1 Tax=Streptomyces sp. H27-D2 TaxID=3046304 RepID=UPI002DBEB5FA|nr:UbiA family prenyltransferase [Streptomyces sp. H27-D2]MEC4021080.1 UbiA family prenyltransferase [Streptomyces sp. H27-D2]